MGANETLGIEAGGLEDKAEIFAISAREVLFVEEVDSELHRKKPGRRKLIVEVWLCRSGWTTNHVS